MNSEGGTFTFAMCGTVFLFTTVVGRDLGLTISLKNPRGAHTHTDQR